MLHQQRLELSEVVRFEAAQGLDHLFGHFERGGLEVESSRPRAENEGQIYMKNGALVRYHNVGIVPIFDIQEVLQQAKAGVTLGEGVHNLIALVSRLAQVPDVADKALLMPLLDLVYGLAILDKLVKGASLFRDYIIAFGILLAQQCVYVLDEFHSDDFVGQLVVVFVEVACEFEVQDDGVAVFGFDEEAVFDVDVDQFAQRVGGAEDEAFEHGGQLAHVLLVLALLLQNAVYLFHLLLKKTPLCLLVLEFEQQSRHCV